MNEAPAPLVSVIVLNLNGEGVIEPCLRHLLQQTHPNYEIIVVDNHSSDGSLAILEDYQRRGKLTLIRSASNLGCPGGRNLGLRQARGEFVAFIDNDGFADPGWLEAALQPFQHDATVGAVAAVVFFNRNRAVLNGAGGTVNWQGYGGDYGFHEPHEFARLPTDVLYPMGCGMVLRRAVLDELGPWDDLLLNYYDDTELGYRLWRSGYRAVVAPRAWVYHEFNYSTQFVPGKARLTEKGRIRTVLKYYPARHLARWLLYEVGHTVSQGPYAYLQLQAWIWNLWHLFSALKWRFKFRSRFEAFERLVSPTWGWFRFPVPTQALYQPDLERLGRSLSVDESADAQLNYGWHWPEKDRRRAFRWTSERASILFRLCRPAETLSLTLKTQLPQHVHLIVRRLGARTPTHEIILDDFPPRMGWGEYTLPCALAAGDYELVLESAVTRRLGRRRVGIAMASVGFT